MGSAAEGLAAVQANDPDRALATVRAKLAKKPNDAFLLYLQADILTQRGPDPGSAEFREAMESAKKGHFASPLVGVPLTTFWRNSTCRRDRTTAAIEQSRKALNSDPKDQTALYHLIQALRKSGRTERHSGLAQAVGRSPNGRHQRRSRTQSIQAGGREIPVDGETTALTLTPPRLCAILPRFRGLRDSSTTPGSRCFLTHGQASGATGAVGASLLCPFRGRRIDRGLARSRDLRRC